MSSNLSIGWLGPTDDAWEWMLGHFEDRVVLREQDVLPWLQRSSVGDGVTSANSRSVLLFASEHRSDSTVALIKRLEEHGISVPWSLLLGTDWSGHRRTLPLPEIWQTFYWYELYDRLIPWLRSVATPVSVLDAPHASSAAGKRKISPRVQRWIDVSQRACSKDDIGHTSNSQQMALVVAQTRETQQLWKDALGRRNLPCVAVNPSQLDLWVEPSIVIVDLEAQPLEQLHGSGQAVLTAQLELHEKIRSLFPNALQVVADAFPRWDRWNHLQNAGADILVAKPYFVDGILESVLQAE